MFESVIVPIDGSPRDDLAVRVAESVARRAGTTIDLLRVAEPDRQDDAKRQLDVIAERLTVRVTRRAVVTAADVVEAIAGEQDHHPGSLVCMATHARTGARELLLGGHAGDVLRQAVQPVLLVGPHATAPLHVGDVLVCLDGSAEAEGALTPAVSWARRMDGRLWLVTVSPPAGVTNRSELGQLRRAAARIDDPSIPVEWDVLHGTDVGDTLVEHARRLPASIIAMTTHGHTGTRERLLGSVAMQVAHDAPVPVLVVRAWR